MLYTAEKTKTDLTGKISEADVGKIDAAIRDLRKAIESKDFGAVKSKADALRKILQDVGSSVYQQAAEQGQAPEQPRRRGRLPRGGPGTPERRQGHRRRLQGSRRREKIGAGLNERLPFLGLL